MIAMYNEPIPGPPNLAVAIGKQLRIQGFIVSSYWDLYPQFLNEMGEWISKGKTKMEGDGGCKVWSRRQMHSLDYSRGKISAK